MKETIYTDTNWRQPFRVSRLPLLATIYAASHRKLNSRLATAVWRRGIHAGFRLLRRAPLGRTGYFEVEIDCDTKRIQFDARNTQFCSIYLPEYVHFGYEPETTALIDKLLSPEDTFYDVGSNWGHISLHVASRPFRGQIHTFEPMPCTFQDLCSVVRQAGLQGRITCHNLALSNDDATKHMRSPDAITSGNAEVSSDHKGVPVQSVRLDDLNLPYPSVMKVDVEGHEREVFAGAKATLAEAKPFIVFENWRGHSKLTTLEPLIALRDAGYHFYQPVSFSAREQHFQIDRNSTDWSQNEKDALGLVEFELDQRMLLGEHINILACHDEKRDRIQALFPHQLNAPIRHKCA